MSERRVDPFTGRGVLIAPFRKGLGATRAGGLPVFEGRCPFCPGHETDTEQTLARWPDDGPWRVRVVRNKYPIASDAYAARGSHEVGIDSPDHDADLADLELEHAAAMLRVYRERVRLLEADTANASVLVFRNRGRRAGSSQPHPHTQIAALSWVPFETALRWERAERHFAEHGRSLHGTALARELSEGVRIVEESEHVVSLCPYAPSRSFEVRLMPRAPNGGFARASDEVILSLATMLIDAMRRLRDRAEIFDFNLVLRQPPARMIGAAAAWHFELLPRTGGDAGFELSTGEMIVVVPPEEAAARLR